MTKILYFCTALKTNEFMKKERLHQSVIAIAVCISLLSFVYVNFFSVAAGNGAVSRKNGPVVDTPSAQIDKDNEESKSAAPTVAVLGYIFNLAQKFVPSGR